MEPGTRTETHPVVSMTEDRMHRMHGDGPLPAARWPHSDERGERGDPETPEAESNIVRGTD